MALYNFYKAGGNVADSIRMPRLLKTDHIIISGKIYVTYNFNIKLRYMNLRLLVVYYPGIIIQTDNTDNDQEQVLLTINILWDRIGKMLHVRKNSSSYTMSKGVGLVGRINYSHIG